MDRGCRVRRRGRPCPTYLVECFASAAGEIETALRLARAFGNPATASRDRIEYLAGLALPDDEQLLLIVRGPDAAAIRATLLDAGLLVERVAEVAIRDGWRPSVSGARSRTADRA